VSRDGVVLSESGWRTSLKTYLAPLRKQLLGSFGRKKDDVRNLFEVAGVPRSLIDARNWQLYKFKIVSPVLDKLNSTESGIGPLRRILHETLSFKGGKHLLWCADGPKLKKEAEESLARRRSLVADRDAAK